MAKLDLRKDRPTAPPATQDVEGASGQLPLEPGKPINLPPDLKTFFEQLGWKDGDPVPNLAAVVEEIQQEQTEALDSTAASDAPIVQPGETLDFEQLSDEHQERLIAAMKEAKEQSQRLDEQASKLVDTPSGDGINEAIQVASVIDDDIEIVNTDEEDLDDEDDEDDEKDLRGKDEAGAFDPTCPNCGWDTTNHEAIKVLETDKYSFMASVLGESRFYKDIELFGGAMTVRYRTLMTQEADLALEQCSNDYRDGVIEDQNSFFRKHADYRLCMGVDKIVVQERTHAIPPVDEIEWDKPKAGEPRQTALPTLLNYVGLHILKNESVRRVVGMAHQKFQRLVERMEANVDNSDFWKAIGLDP